MSANIFLATTGHGLARAERDANAQWSVQHLLGDQDVRCLAADPNNSSIIYAGTQGNGVFSSSDGGKSWQPAGLSGHKVKAISVSRAEPGTIYAGTKPAYLYVSRDAGEHWTEFESFRHIPGRRLWFSPAETPFTAYVQGIAPSPTDPNVIVVGIEAGAVVRSTDGGRTWTSHRKGALRDCHSVTFHISAGNWVYEAGGTGAGASYSQSAGDTWIQPSEGLDRHYGWACAADSARPDVWYVSASPLPKSFSPPPAHVDGKADAAIYRKQGDAPWQRLTGGLPQPLNYMAYALLTDPDASGHLYAGLSSGEIWHSSDLGETWQAMPFNLGSIHRSMVIT